MGVGGESGWLTYGDKDGKDEEDPQETSSILGKGCNLDELEDGVEHRANTKDDEGGESYGRIAVSRHCVSKKKQPKEQGRKR